MIKRDQQNDLLIRQKCEAMIEYGHVAIRQFPKMERHVLGAEIRGTMWGVLRLIVVCNKRYHKKTTLQELDAEIDLLRSQVRMAKNMGHLDFNKYEHWAKLNDEIGRMVGALTSQLAANIMLNRLDHIAKDDMGIRFYVRYMDDFVAIMPDKASAQKVMLELGEAVNGLALSLNPKTAIHPWQRGIDFCGYRIWPTHILPRKRNVKRARLAFREMAAQYHDGEIDLEFVRQRVMSFIAYSKHCSAHRTVEGVLGDLILVRSPLSG